jgi:hypothetical protein
MKKTSLNDLRDHLFDAIERLKSKNDPNTSENEKMDIETAKTIANIGTVIVNSAKIEVDAMRAIANAQNPKALQAFMKRSEVLQIPESTETE